MASFSNPLETHDLVDLSVPFGEEYPMAFPDHQQFRHKVHNWYEPIAGPQRIASSAPYYDCWMVIDEHSGTHFDAPPHFVPPPASGLPHAGPAGAITGDLVPLAWLQGPAAVIDCRALPKAAAGVSPRLTLDGVQAWESEHGPIAAGDVVILFGGWDQRFLPMPEGRGYTIDALDATGPAWPAPEPDVVLYCRERGVRLIGTDAGTIGAADDLAAAHYAGLENELLFVESLSGLERLPARGAYFVFLPLKVLRSSGAPGRAIAYVPRAA